MESTLAETLFDISQKTHEDCAIKTYHIPYLPRRIYIEAPGIVEIQELMKYSAYGHLVSRATRILDDMNRNFLHSTSAPDVPCIGSWVRIIQPGIYRGDLGVVLLTPTPTEPSDIVLIAVVPRYTVSMKKRKGGRPAPALLDPNFVARFPSSIKNNMHVIKSRMFHPNGLEVLGAPSTHALKIESRPSEAELMLFQSSFGQLDVAYETEDVIQTAVNRAFRKESRRLWRAGDRVRILKGAFIGMSCSIHEIDEPNRTVIVEFDSLNPTCVEVSMEDLERQFFIGDQVRVALGNNKGRTGAILKINESVGIIVEGTANQLTEVNSPSIFIRFLFILPSLKFCCSILRAITWPLLSPPLLIRLLHQ
jgi:ribosomal protein L24